MFLVLTSVNGSIKRDGLCKCYSANGLIWIPSTAAKMKRARCDPRLGKRVTIKNFRHTGNNAPFINNMTPNQKKRQAQVKAELAKPMAQEGLQELLEYIHALTEQVIERRAVRRSKRKPARLSS